MPRVSRTDWQLEQPAMLRLLDGDDRRQARETDGSSVLIDDDATSVWRRDLYQAAEWLTLWGLNEAAVAALKLLQRKHPARTADGVLLFRRPCRSIS